MFTTTNSGSPLKGPAAAGVARTPTSTFVPVNDVAPRLGEAGPPKMSPKEFADRWKKLKALHRTEECFFSEVSTGFRVPCGALDQTRSEVLKNLLPAFLWEIMHVFYPQHLPGYFQIPHDGP